MISRRTFIGLLSGSALAWAGVGRHGGLPRALRAASRAQAATAAATGTSTSPGRPRFAINEYPEIPLTNAQLALRDIVVLQQSAVHPNGTDGRGRTVGDPQRIAKIKAVNPNCKVLLYDFLQTTWDWSYKYGQLRSEWFLTVKGERCANPDRSDRQYLMDINNPAYVDWIAGYYAREIQTYGFDGFFQDGIWPTIHLGQGWVGWRPAPAETYQHNWPQYMHNLYAALRAKIGSKLIISNCTPTNGREFGTDDMYLDVLDGTLCEGWVHEPWAKRLDPTSADWAFCRHVLQRNVARSKYFIALPGTADGFAEDQLRLFTFCTYLLDADGTYAMYEWGHPWETDIHRDLGTALGPAVQSGGLWKREFSKATITVTPDSKKGTITPK